MFINQNDLLLSKNLFSPRGCGISPRRCVVAPNRWKSDQIGAMGHQIGELFDQNGGNLTKLVRWVTKTVEIRPWRSNVRLWRFCLCKGQDMS